MSISVEKEAIQQKLDSQTRSRADCEKLRGELELETRELKEKLKEQHIEFEHVRQPTIVVELIRSDPTSRCRVIEMVGDFVSKGLRMSSPQRHRPDKIHLIH